MIDRLRVSVRALPLLLLSPLLLACLWDYDTLKMELADFPSSLELITGKFRRHSDDYYRWRIEDRTKKLPVELDTASVDHLPLLDDIAVAYDKLGNHGRAIQFADHTLRLAPDRYESLANRGTFKIHAGELESGLADLKRAIEINPDAHFGREIVQVRLVEFLIFERGGRATLPLTTPRFGSPGEHGFEAFREALEVPLERKDAIKGLLGMLRFGHHDHPILLDVLAEQFYAEGHKRMATRAYLKASMEVKDLAVQEAYRKRAKDALDMQTPNRKTHKSIPLTEFEETFRAELADAAAYFALITENERKWIAAGDDVDARYAEKYFPGQRKSSPPKGSPIGSLLLLIGGLAVVVGVLRS